MEAYIVTVGVVGSGGPKYDYRVEAHSEEGAYDVAMDNAFADHPQFGAFYIDDIRTP